MRLTKLRAKLWQKTTILRGLLYVGNLHFFQASYLATVVRLRDTVKYPLFVRTIASSFPELLANLRVYRHFNWTRTATIAHIDQFASWVCSQWGNIVRYC